jgi:hypothetical protein
VSLLLIAIVVVGIPFFVIWICGFVGDLKRSQHN